MNDKINYSTQKIEIPATVKYLTPELICAIMQDAIAAAFADPDEIVSNDALVEYLQNNPARIVRVENYARDIRIEIGGQEFVVSSLEN